jgi:hypothetical protein
MEQQLRAAMAAVDRGCPVQTAALDYHYKKYGVQTTSQTLLSTLDRGNSLGPQTLLKPQLRRY